jgi:hypothetical protein
MSGEEQSKQPFTAWGTKGFEFWTFLSILLKAARPRAILELGCGRSSTFFADYAYAHDARYVGIENDHRWFNKTSLDIELLGFGRRHLAHVPLVDNGSWYDMDRFRQAVGEPGRFDFALIDAPNEKRFFANEEQVAKFFRPEDGNPFGHRDDPAGLAAIRSVAGSCEVMMVDDVHKTHVFDTVDRMLDRPGSYERHYFTYKPHPSTTNGLCICLKQDSAVAQKLPTMASILGVTLTRNYRPADQPRGFSRFFKPG